MISLELKSWLNYSNNTDFPIQNIPFGIASINGEANVVSRIGDHVIVLNSLYNKKAFDGISGLSEGIFKNKFLNNFIALGKPITNAVRKAIADFFSLENSDNKASKDEVIYDINQCQMLLPLQIGDYTDFYSSKEHATNVGTMFRDPNNALLPNWLHLPVGYHGRASSIVISGTDIRRPSGQTIPADSDQPVYGPCRLMDFELEMGFVIGKPNELGTAVDVNDASDHIFGMMLFNDWSARDIQKWEYVPLGPFLGKNFASTISPWIVTTEALELFKVTSPEQDPEVLDYLKQKDRFSYDLSLTASIKLPSGEETTITKSNFKYMYWTQAQQLAHHTVNGCNMRVGDVCASGTISGKTPDSYGSMLELSWKGTKPLDMPDGSQRKFLLDGDTLTLRGYGEKNGIRIGFGEATGKILPAK